MPSAHSPRGRLLFLISAAALIVAVACLIVAAPQRKPVREEMVLNEVPVVAQYSPSASSDDLMLPFYRGARLEAGFTYRVTTKDGKPVTYYASAAFTTPDPPERVAERYSQQLPGRPKPELVTDKAGKRYLLAVASEREVRKVTIVPQQRGSRIELTRATAFTIPQKPITPRGPQERAA